MAPGMGLSTRSHSTARQTKYDHGAATFRHFVHAFFGVHWDEIIMMRCLYLLTISHPAWRR